MLILWKLLTADPCAPSPAHGQVPGGGLCGGLRSDLLLLNHLGTAVGGSAPSECLHTLPLSQILNQALGGKKWQVLKK